MCVEYPEFFGLSVLAFLGLWRIKAIERIRDQKNRDVLVLLECEQMRIARDNHIGFGRNGTRDDVIVIWIVEYGRQDGRGFYNGDDTLIALPQLAGVRRVAATAFASLE